MFLFDVVKALKKEEVKFAIVGGYAMALHGVVRATIDVDLVIKLNKKQYQSIEKAMSSLGLKSRLPITSSDIALYKDEYIKTRNLIAWSFIDYKNPSKIVDVLLTEDLKKEDYQVISVGGLKIPTIKIEKLYKMKSETGREKDKQDLKLLKPKISKGE